MIKENSTFGLNPKGNEHELAIGAANLLLGAVKERAYQRTASALFSSVFRAYLIHLFACKQEDCSKWRKELKKEIQKQDTTLSLLKELDRALTHLENSLEDIKKEHPDLAEFVDQLLLELGPFGRI